jgi:hypothetical protein
MKVRLTESQYNNLLRTINPNKKLTITESQYKRLILEANSQDVFAEIKPGQAFKITASGKEFKFEVIDSNNGQLLVKNLNDTTDVYFFIDYNAIQNKTLITYKSKENAGVYNKIDGKLDKERLKSWSKYTIKNLTKFEVFETKLFNKSLFSINTDDGQKIEVQTNVDDDEDESKNRIVNFKDNLIRGIEPNKSYQLTFHDNSTLKFFVKEKEGDLLNINFKTKSGKADMSYSDIGDKELKNKELWFREQDKLIGQLKNQLQKTNDVNQQKEIQNKIDKTIKSKDEYDLKYPRLEGLQTISKSDYTNGAASKWVENLENSVEFKFGKDLKLDLNATKIHLGKPKVKNVGQDEKIADLKEKLANASDDEEKKQLKKELNNIEKINTLHFLNPEFDVFYPDDDISTFDLTLLLEYRPNDVRKQTSKTSMEWTPNPTKELKVKKFGLNGIKQLTIIEDKSEPLLSKKEPIEKTKIDLDKEFSANLQNIDKLIKADPTIRNTVLNKPNKFLELTGMFKDKGILPLEKLQRDIGSLKTDRSTKDKFVAGQYVGFKPDFNTAIETSGFEQEFEIFKNLFNDEKPGKGLVKKYSQNDNHVVLTMRRRDNTSGKFVYYYINIENELPSDNVNDLFSVILKVSYAANQIKEKVATFNIKINKKDGYSVKNI